MDKKSRKGLLWLVAIVTVLVLASLAVPVPAMAQANERDFSVSIPYTHIVVGIGQEVQLDVKVTNLGKRDEEIALSVSGPENWGARIERQYNQYEVRAVYVPFQVGSNSVDLLFKAKPPERAAEGDYRFTLAGVTKDGKVRRSLDITITLKQKVAAVETKGVELTSGYASLEQAAGKDFEFEVVLKNGSDKERVFDLAAQIPGRWTAYVTPRWETEKRIKSTKVSANGQETLRLVLTPPVNVEKGDYSATLEARAGDDTGSIKLKATVTGTYTLQIASEAEVLGTGETRNVRATAGRDKLVTIYLWNEGSATISNLTVFSSKPADWEVTFEPDKIPSLNPVTKELKPEKVEVTIRPKVKAIPGDYMVTLTASGGEAYKQLELRVTVVTPTAWGWVGIVIVVAVLATLMGIFVRLGRR